jgi:hypothetical protein
MPHTSCIAVRHDSAIRRAIEPAAVVVAVAAVAFAIATVVGVAEHSCVQYNRSCSLHGKSDLRCSSQALCTLTMSHTTVAVAKAAATAATVLQA